MTPPSHFRALALAVLALGAVAACDSAPAKGGDAIDVTAPVAWSGM